MAVAAVLLGIAIVGVYQPAREALFPNSGNQGLTINPGKPDLIREPNGTTIVVLTAGVRGGTSPYVFTCVWSDGVNQTNTSGLFQRSFAPGLTIPASVHITVKSADGRTASVTVTIQA